MTLELSRRIEELKAGFGLPVNVSETQWNRVLLATIPDICEYHDSREKLASGFSYNRNTTDLVFSSSITYALGVSVGLSEVENISGTNPWSESDLPERIPSLREKLFEKSYPAWPLIVVFDLGRAFDKEKRSPAYDVWAALPK